MVHMAGIAQNVSFQLGSYRVIPNENCIAYSQSDECQKAILQPKFIDVLAYLASRYPEVVTREELIEHIWQGNTYVGSKALTNAIWHLRKQFNLFDSQIEVIETVRKTGYQLLIEPIFDEVIDELEPLLEQTQQQLDQTHSRVKYGIALFSLLVVILSIAAGWHLYQDQQQAKQTYIEQLTRLPGAERYPIVSPDGRWLVYGSRKDGKSTSLYLQSMKDPSLLSKRLTANTSSEMRAVWSPDNGYLYYASEQSHSGECQLTQLTLASGKTQVIGECYRDHSAIDISPDGDSLYYIWRAKGAARSGIYQLSLTAKEAKPKRLSCQTDCDFVDRDLAISQDGKVLAIARRFGHISEDIFIRDLATNQERRLTQGLEDIRGLTWHSDNQRLIYSTETSGIRKGFVLDIVSGEITSLDIDGMSYPRYNLTGTELVYARYSKLYQIAQLAVAEQIPSMPFPLIVSEFSHRNPDYSDIAKRIAYVSNESGHNEIWTADEFGHSRRQHTQLKRRVAYPRWSPDGTMIAFLAPDENNEGNKIHILDLSTGDISILASNYVSHRRLIWTFDNKRVLTSTDTGLFSFGLDNSQAQFLGDIRVRHGEFINDKELLFSRSGRKGLWKMSLDTPSQLSLVISSNKFTDYYNWVVTAKGVYFRQMASQSQTISFWDAQTEAVRPILKIPTSTISNIGAIDYMAERQQLLLTLADYSQRDIMRLQHKLLYH